MKRVGLFLFPDVEELDFVGPWEVFQMVNEVAGYKGDPAPLNNQLISKDGEDVLCRKAMRVGAHAAMGDVTELDVLLVPGGNGTRPLLDDAAVIDWIKGIAPGCEWVTSVCTGSLVLAKAGLLDGKRATTHWSAFDEFDKRGFDVELLPHVRYVRDSNVVTSAGVSAGIDMALWLVGQWFSPKFAREVAHAMQYDPAPPYQGEV